MLGRTRQLWAKRWPKVDGWTTWVVLSRFRNSFFSRAVTALSLSSLVLANLPGLLARSGIDNFSLRLVFTGSLIFLLGYLLFLFWAPPEFSQSGEIYEHVQRMQSLADKEFVESLMNASTGLVDRARLRKTFVAPIALIKGLEEKAKALQGKNNFEVGEMAGLFHADLALRQHDWPVRRLVIAAALVLGAACLAFPTIRNVLRAIG